jgi:hypothetical protein
MVTLCTLKRHPWLSRGQLDLGSTLPSADEGRDSPSSSAEGLACSLLSRVSLGSYVLGLGMWANGVAEGSRRELAPPLQEPSRMQSAKGDERIGFCCFGFTA